MKCKLIIINGTVDHVHAAVTIPPHCCVAEWIKNIKGYSSRELNYTFNDTMERFHWQSGYGVLTFGARNLDLVVNYIERQKIHHVQGTLEAYLERMEEA
jgi:putative transposase